MEEELERVRASQDDTIASICGSSFEVQPMMSDADWQQCGADGSGSIAEAELELESRHAEMLSSQTRLDGMAEKIRIDENTLSRTQGVRSGTMRFVSNTGEELQIITVQEGIINAAQKALELSSNASLLNAGASAGMGAAAAVFETQRTALNVRRQQLETAQTLRFQKQDAEIELINGMAEIKKQLVDLHQLEVDMQQVALGITQSQLAARNQLEQVKRAATERERTLARISNSPYSDPTYRLLMNRSALQAINARREAQRWLYRAGRALEYEINTPLGDALNRAILGAHNATEAQRLKDCFLNIFNEYSTEFGIPQEFTTTVSVREMLGVTGPRTDEVTGEELSEGELFRRILLKNENLDGQGGVGVEFSTNLEPGNELWSSNVCDDKIKAVRAQLVGDFQGNNEAEVHLVVEGGGMMRRCDSEELINWSIDSADIAVVQAGVNTFGSAPENTTLFGHSVARPNWRIIIPGSETAPSNSDLDLTGLEDIVLEIKHKALPRSGDAVGVSLQCLGTVGAGG